MNVRFDRLLVWIIAGLVPLVGAAAEPDTGPEESFKVRWRLPQSPSDLPAQFDGQYVYLETAGPRSEPLWFLLDTGSTVDLVSAKDRRTLGLNPLAELNINDTTGNIWCDGVPFRLGRVRYFPGRLGMSSFFDDMESVAGRRIDGVFGGPFFATFVVSINYEGRRVQVYDRTRYRYEGRGERLPLRVGHALPWVAGRVIAPGDPAFAAEFLLDFGFNGAIRLPQKLLDAYGVGLNAARTQQELGLGINGLYTNSLVRLGGLQLGKLTLDRPIASIAENDREPPLIGAEVLRRFTVTLDYSRREIALEPNSFIREPFEADMSGIHVKAKGPSLRKYVIEAVRPNSPASDANLKAGDVLVQVDGRPAEQWDLPTLRNHWEQDGRVCTLVVEREGQPITATLHLKRQI